MKAITLIWPPHVSAAKVSLEMTDDLIDNLQVNW